MDFTFPVLASKIRIELLSKLTMIESGSPFAICDHPENPFVTYSMIGFDIKNELARWDICPI